MRKIHWNFVFFCLPKNTFISGFLAANLFNSPTKIFAHQRPILYYAFVCRFNAFNSRFSCTIRAMQMVCIIFSPNISYASNDMRIRCHEVDQQNRKGCYFLCQVNRINKTDKISAQPFHFSASPLPSSTSLFFSSSFSHLSHARTKLNYSFLHRKLFVSIMLMMAKSTIQQQHKQQQQKRTRKENVEQIINQNLF